MVIRTVKKAIRRVVLRKRKEKAMSKKLTDHMMKMLVERLKQVDETGVDFELYMSVVSEKDALVKSDNDFNLGLALGILLMEHFNIIDGLEFKFLSKVEGGKLYELSVGYTPDHLEQMVEADLGL